MKVVKNNVLNGNEFFSDSNFFSVVCLFFKNISKMYKLQDKLNSRCKAILLGKSVPNTLLNLNEELHNTMSIVKSCMAFLKGFNLSLSEISA